MSRGFTQNLTDLFCLSKAISSISLHSIVNGVDKRQRKMRNRPALLALAYIYPRQYR
jgi:hypothetical protein